MSVFRLAVLRPALAVLIVLAAQNAFAVDYYADPVGGVWSANTTWDVGAPGGATPAPGVYPGSAAGDRAFVAAPPAGVSVTSVIPNGVELFVTCASCFVSVNAGGTLTLINASSITTGGGMSLNAGGVLTGTGTLTLDAGTQFGVSGGSLDGLAVNLNGTLTQTGAWSIDNGGTIAIGATGLYDIQTIGPVTSNNLATSRITNNGTFRKSGGAGGTNVDVAVDNNNLVQAQTNALVLGGAGSPVHTNATFDISSGASIELYGTFTGTSTIQGLGTANIVGTPVIDNGGIVNVSATILMSGGWIQGPVAGSATMNVSGLVTFNGGVWQRNLTVNMQSGSQLDFTGAAAAFINSAHVNNDSGALITLTPGGGLSLDNTGWISNNGTFRLLGDAVISTNGFGSSRIDNDSLFEKTAGAGIAGINVTLNNNASGSVASTSGNIAFTKSSAHSGTFNVCNGCFFDFSNGTHTFSGSTFNGATGFTKVSNIGIFFLSTGGAVIDTQFVQTGGTVSGTDTLTVNNAFTWMGGTQDGSGETVLGAFSHAFNGSTGVMTLARKLTNNGTITYNGGTNALSINTGGWLVNNATFNIFGDYQILSAGSGLFDNASGAFLNKTAGTGQAGLSCALNNAGTVNVSNGQLAVAGGGTNSGLISIPGLTNVFAINGGVYTFASGTFINPADLGFVSVAIGTLTLSAPMTLDNVALDSGIITGSDLSIAEKLVWTGGKFLGPGNTNVNLGAVVDHTGATSITTLDGRTYNNAGTFNYDPGALQNLLLTNSAVFNNNGGTLFILGDRFIASGTGTNLFNNNAGGQVRKTGGTSGTRFDMPLHNVGTVSSEVSGGTIIVNGGGSMNAGGTMTTTVAGANIDFFNGTFTVGGGGFTGTGKIRVVGGTLQINANVNAFTTLEVNSGILEVSSPNTFQITTLEWNGGTIQGSGTKRVFGGFIGNTAPTTLAGSGTLTIPGPAFSYNADNVNFLSITGTADLNIESGATMTITGSGIIGGAPTGALTSTGGTLAKTGGSTAQVDVPVDFTIGSGGAINVTGGSLNLNGGGAIEAAMQIGAGANLHFTGGTFSIDPGATLGGTGSFWIDGGTVNFNTPLTIPSFFLTGGTLGGTANVTVQGSGWSGGTMTGTGSFIVDNAAMFSTGGISALSSSRPITNSGTFHVAGSQPLTTTAPFDNKGSVTFISGPPGLILNGGGTHTGDFTTQFGNPLIFGGASHTFSATSDVSGNGFVTFTATTSTLSGTYTNGLGGATQLSSGTTTLFNTTSPAQAALISIDGNLGGTAAFQVTGNGGSWQTGTLSGTAPFTIVDAGAFFAANGLNGPMTLSRPLVSNGQFVYNSTTNPLALAGGSIDNNGTFQYSGSANVGIGPGGGTFNNDGTFLRDTSGALVIFDPAFTNNNLARFLTGTVSFNGGYTQTAGTTELNGGNIASPLAVAINGGSLIGSGTVTGDLTNDGAVSPGLSPGQINITGDYTQTANATLNIEIGGTAPGTGYDQLVVGGTADLDGTINVAIINSFAPIDGDTFDVLTFSARNGDWATRNIPAFPGGSFDELYTANSFRLVADVTNDVAIVKSGPLSAQPGDVIAYTITVSNSGPGNADDVIVSDPGNPALTFISNSGDCATPFPCSLGTIGGGSSKTITATYAIDNGTAGSTIVNTASVTSTTPDASPGNNSSSASVIVGCVNAAPSNLTPSGTNVPVNGTLSWSPTGGEIYTVYFGPAGSGCSTVLGTTSGTSMAYSGLAANTTYEWRVESSVSGCPTLTSGCVSFTTAKAPEECVAPAAPLASVVGQATSSKTYAVQWDPVPNAVRYEVQEATNPEFVNAVSTTTTGLESKYKHDTNAPVAWYYRVRAFVACTNAPGPFSPTIRIIIVPLPPADEPNLSATVPVGTEELVVQEIFIPGEPGQTLFFTAVTDRPWLEVRPPSGVLPPEGVTLEVIGKVKDLPNGTFTASIIVTTTATASNGSATHDGPTVTTTPFSVNLVTPVTPVGAKPATSQFALIIPSVGHLDGIDSHWQSDVRVTNAGFRSTRYRLTFTPSAGSASGVKQTTITVDAGTTTALDDVIKNWFGAGSVGDGTNGMLEILPLDDPANTFLATVASSRTYNVTAAAGTLGQFIPAVPFTSFIGRAAQGALPPVLSLQQIAQAGVFRTNVGLAEAGGKPANATLSIFNGAGQRLLDIPQLLAAGQQIQLNALLAQHGIELADGRIEVQVGSGDGKITAYASVIDGSTGDPLLVNGTLLGTATSTKYVLPGVANLNNPVAHWRTDVRAFNFGTVDQQALVTFHPFNAGPSTTIEVLLAAGKVVALDNILASRFNVENTGGVIHITTPQPSSLVVTARTFNQTDNGTFGQFIPAVTPAEATGAGGRTLNILQVEDSVRYRTNIGIAEVTGQPVTVELQVYLPDSKITPTVQLQLAPNEFRQFALIRELGLGNVYNARVTARVISGAGRVTAYGSIIDEITQDPTYVPAQ